jgi:hypothetical protein
MSNPPITYLPVIIRISQLAYMTYVVISFTGLQHVFQAFGRRAHIPGPTFTDSFWAESCFQLTGMSADRKIGKVLSGDHFNPFTSSVITGITDTVL